MRPELEGGWAPSKVIFNHVLGRGEKETQSFVEGDVQLKWQSLEMALPEGGVISDILKAVNFSDPFAGFIMTI